jgi:hypothetical protein
LAIVNKSEGGAFALEIFDAEAPRPRRRLSPDRREIRVSLAFADGDHRNLASMRPYSRNNASHCVSMSVCIGSGIVGAHSPQISTMTWASHC